MVFKELYKKLGKDNRTRISNLTLATLALSVGVMCFGSYQIDTKLSKIDRDHPRVVRVEELENKLDSSFGSRFDITLRKIANDKNILNEIQDYAVGLVREVDSLRTLDDYNMELTTYKSKKDKARDVPIPLFVGGGLIIASFIGKVASYRFKN